MNNCIAIITARGGSKRIPRKNIRSFLGKPIMSYSIQAALESGCFEEVMVSTDDNEIANIAITYGARVPFLRSAATSTDHATTAEVIIEVLEAYKKKGKTFTHCCCIYATAPFITAAKLQECYKQLQASNAHALIPVVQFSFPIFRSFKIEEGKVKMNWPEHINTRSQDLQPAYHDSGQFYFLKTDTFISEKKIFSDFTIPYILSESEVQDIDTEEDWKIAEIKYQSMKSKYE
jgi:pseudaminic acid cytidylyltransferase